MGATTTTNTGLRSRVVGAFIGMSCTLGCFLLMARQGQTPHATLIGALLLCGAICGWFSSLGLLDPQHGSLALSDTALFPLPGELRWLAPVFTLPAVLVMVCVQASLAAQYLPCAILIALCLLLLSALRRPGLFVFVLAAFLYLPRLGSYALWDPWETHYGEVTREILARDDWISLWWAQDGWFWSKPILIFWAEALTWSASGLGFHADQHAAYTEWVLRLPIFAMSSAGLVALYFGIARVWTQRAGVLAATVLATTPYYAFLTHQAITDMPFVANMTIAMMCFVMACTEDPDKRVRTLRVGSFGVSLQHAVLALILGVGLPQFLYLASRNITWIPPLFVWHHDLFTYGSAGNAGIPGNPAAHVQYPAVDGLWFEPLTQALVGVSLLFFVVWRLRRERRIAALYMFAFYVFCGLSFMAKGIPGFALPGLIILFYLIAARRFSLLLQGRLHVAMGALTMLVLSLPWFIAMFVRHGHRFTDRILIHDHINRLTSGVHGDNGSIQYFIWQLGYGVFPWFGVCVAALASWLFASRAGVPVYSPDATHAFGERRAERTKADAHKHSTLLLLGLWFAVTFSLFSAMTTKFHHYIFPAVPPLAALIGILLDDWLPAGAFSRKGGALLRTLAAMLGSLLWVLAAAGARGDVRGVIPSDAIVTAHPQWVLEHPWPMWACTSLCMLGLASLLYSVRRCSVTDGALPRGTGEGSTSSIGMTDRSPLPIGAVGSSPLPIGAALVAGAILLAFIGRDLSWNTSVLPPGSERFIHLFVYNYKRPWPDYLDYRPILFGFSCVAVIATLATSVPRLRPTAASGLLGLAVGLCVFCLDVYMLDLTPHWTQRHLIERYYRERSGSEEPLIAWQMNWKGENLYTGNHVYAFAQLDNKALLAWIGKNTGRRVFFLLEHSRLERFKRLLAPRSLRELTTLRDCNKFLLVSTTL